MRDLGFMLANAGGAVRIASHSHQHLNSRGKRGGINYPTLSLRVHAGFGKALAIKTILLAVAELNLEDEDFKSLYSQLRAIVYCKAVYSPAGDTAAQVNKAIGDKMGLAEAKRPDILQIATGFRLRAFEESLEMSIDLMTKYANDFNNASDVQGQKLTSLESTCLFAYPTMTSGTVSKLDYHWQKFPVERSAVTLGRLAALVGLDGAELPSKPDASDLWKTKIYNITPEKRETNLKRQIGIFLANIKNQAAS